MQGAHPRRIIARGEQIRAFAKPVNGYQHLLPDDTEREYRHDDRRSHAEQREQDPALERPSSGRDFGAGTLVCHRHQSGDGRGQVSF